MSHSSTLLEAPEKASPTFCFVILRTHAKTPCENGASSQEGDPKNEKFNAGDAILGPFISYFSIKKLTPTGPRENRNFRCE